MAATLPAEFVELVRQCREAVGQQVSGRTEAFQALWSKTDDVVLMGAAGSHQVGWPDVSARLTWASEHLNYGGFTVENLLTSVDGTLGFTVDLEHMSRRVNGQTEQRTLRATQGYRFTGGEWRVVFRHGDPIADTVQLPTG